MTPPAATPRLTPTEEQAEVCEATTKSSDSLMIKAYAGCAKTSTLEMAGARIKSPALALAFNKSIATELAKRFAGNFEVKTMNGFGFGALVRSRPEITKWDLNTKKLGKIISGLAKERKIDLNGDSWDGLRRFVSAAMTAGIAPDGEGLVPDTAESWAAVAESLWLPEAEFEFYYELGHDILRKNNEATRRGTISFDDQVYYPTLYGAKFPQFPVMLVDEAQDLNALNHAMLSRAMRPDGRLLVCGDPKQSIYGFRGSVNDSMGKIAGLRPNWQNLPLTLTFRCPKAIVARQQGHAPGFRAYHGNAEGVAARWEGDPADPLKFEGWNWHTVVQAIPGQGSSMAILCRNNGPLFDMAFKLLRQGIGVVMLGRDLGKGLVLLIRKLADPAMGVAEFMIKLRDWRETEETLAKANDQDERVAGIVDRYECIVAVAQGAGCRTVAEVVAQLERLFARESGVVTLGSIHRAKGLEWDMVIHLDPWRIPSKQAKRAAQQGDHRQMEQEWNLRYVCETRTKHTLIEANLQDFIP